MYCLTNLCYVCLEMKNNLIRIVDSSLSVNKELLDIFCYCAHNLAWLETKRITLICEECCSRLRETYQFLKMWHKNSALLQCYVDLLKGSTLSNTENEAELLVHLQDINQVKCEIKDEQIYTDEYEPIIEEKEDVFVDFEDFLTKEGNVRKREAIDDREEYPMDNNSTESMNNISNSVISVNSNAHITNTDHVSSAFTCKQVPATNTKDSNTPANKPYTCSTCNTSFTTETALMKHTQIHTIICAYILTRNRINVLPYQCAKCDECFSEQSNLVCHLQTHT